jgi:5-methylcytosine-specific restriction endonuclease McrA
MHERYVTQLKPLRALAREAKCGLRTIARWIEIHGIGARDNKTATIMAVRYGPENPNWKGGPKKFYCVSCGGPRNHLAKKHCFPCRNIANKGTGNPNYRGLLGVKEGVRQWSQKVWRIAVFERDRYKCQSCGSDNGGNLNAHHIVSLSSILRRKRAEWRGDLRIPEERVRFIDFLILDDEVSDLSNGITLCKPCHINEHRRGFVELEHGILR